MLEVIVKKNGRTITRETAQNIGPPIDPPVEDARLYELSDGSTIQHCRRFGAHVLAARLLLRQDEVPEWGPDRG